jgi:hypothetical protein
MFRGAPPGPVVLLADERRRGRTWSGPRDLVTLPIVLAFGLLITYVRGPSVIRHPTFWAEDGTFWFHDAYTSGWLSSLFRPHAGYLQVFPRLVADVGLLVPLRRVPLLFVAVALIVQVLPAVLVASRRYAVAVPDYRVRLLLAALYLLAPNSSEVNVNLTNAQWHLGLLAVMVVLAVPATGLWRVFDLAVVGLCGLTGPFVLALIVVAVILFHLRRQRWTLILGAVAVVTGVGELVVLANSPRGDNGTLGVSVSRFLDVLGGRVIGNTLLGTHTTISGWYLSHLLVCSTVFAVAAAVVVGLVVWRGPLELKLFNLFAGLVLCGSLLSPVGTPGTSQWTLMALDPGARYWLFPSLAFLVDLVWVAGQVGSVRRWGAPLAALLLVVVALFGIREDFRYPVVAAPNWPVQVAEFDRLPVGASYTFQIRPPGWTVVLTKK